MMDEQIIGIAEQAYLGIVEHKIGRINGRVQASEQAQAEHRRAGRGIEACACEIRAQAFREAVAILRERELEPLRSFVSQGRRSAERRDPSKPGEN